MLSRRHLTTLLSIATPPVADVCGRRPTMPCVGAGKHFRTSAARGAYRIHRNHLIKARGGRIEARQAVAANVTESRSP